MVGVAGLPAIVSVTNAEPANDTLAINAFAGDGVVVALGLAVSSIALTLDGDASDDVLVGSAGSDTPFGRDGDDLLIGGLGQDVLDGGPGNNVLIQD
jgi:Ca2+-binding RTX toxin-like protein